MVTLGIWISAMRAAMRARVIAACWRLLMYLEAQCPVCAAPTASTQHAATKVCADCAQPLLPTTLRQHDGAFRCIRCKGAA